MFPVLAASLVIMASDCLPSPQPQHLPMTSYSLWDKFQTLPVAQAKNLVSTLDTSFPPHLHSIHQKTFSAVPLMANLTPSCPGPSYLPPPTRTPRSPRILFLGSPISPFAHPFDSTRVILLKDKSDHTLHCIQERSKWDLCNHTEE